MTRTVARRRRDLLPMVTQHNEPSSKGCTLSSISGKEETGDDSMGDEEAVEGGARGRRERFAAEGAAAGAAAGATAGAAAGAAAGATKLSSSDKMSTKSSSSDKMASSKLDSFFCATAPPSVAAEIVRHNAAGLQRAVAISMSAHMKCLISVLIPGVLKEATSFGS